MELTLNNFTLHQALALQSVLQTQDKVVVAECAITTDNMEETKPLYQEAMCAYKGAMLRTQELGIQDTLGTARDYNRLCASVKFLGACLKKEVGAPLTTKDRHRLLWEQVNLAAFRGQALICRPHRAGDSFYH